MTLLYISLFTYSTFMHETQGCQQNSDGHSSCKPIGCMLLLDIFQQLVNGFHGVRNSCGIGSN